MPRTARIKSPDAMYHVMSRSISEINLFRDDFDKNKYLEILKRYMNIFKFKIYTYCLMDNHSHILIDANGADISKIFHAVNFSYAIYYNRKYKRHGHLFQGRFRSKIVDNSSYFIKLSAYIHNNPNSIKEYENKVEFYEHSSLGLYLEIRDDIFELVERGYLLTLFGNSNYTGNTKKAYLKYLKSCQEEVIDEESDFKDQRTIVGFDRKVLYRNCNVDKVTEFLKKRMNISEAVLLMRNSKRSAEHRAIYTLFLKCFCNYRNKEIGNIIGNLSQSSISKLCSMGLELVKERHEYKNLLPEFIKELG